MRSRGRDRPLHREIAPYTGELLSMRSQARVRECRFARETAGKMLGLAGNWLAGQERVGLEAEAVSAAAIHNLCSTCDTKSMRH